MELTIDFTCPQCRLPTTYPLREIAPGQQRNCPVCKVRLELTPHDLQILSHNLENYCNS